ncbi:MAG: hypothetical protein GY795_13925 [Desulfobacterales bacterium]|nr:hypothetical protein [Desulfobacterales bacterium]
MIKDNTLNEKVCTPENEEVCTPEQKNGNRAELFMPFKNQELENRILFEDKCPYV